MKYQYLLFPALVLFIGCGRTGDISGTITCNGNQVLSGTVMVSPKPGLIQYGRIRKDGTYTIKDVPVGEVLVAVNSPKIVARPGTEPSPRVTGWVPIPPKFNDLLSSGLTYEVQKGENAYDIELTGEVEPARNGRRASR